MTTPVTAEGVFDKHAVALGLPARETDEATDAYIKRLAALPETATKRKEAERCLAEAAAAAAIADHVDVAHWLDQTRQHMPPA